jgi:hypothetical protein
MYNSWILTAETILIFDINNGLLNISTFGLKVPLPGKAYARNNHNEFAIFSGDIPQKH